MRIVKLSKESKENLLADLLKRDPNNYGQYADTVQAIVDDVKARGDEALFEYTEKFDKVKVTKDTIRVTKEEIDEALKQVDPKLMEVMVKSMKNIRAFHEKQKQLSWFDTRRHDSWSESYTARQCGSLCSRRKGCISVFCFNEYHSGRGSRRKSYCYGDTSWQGRKG